MSISIPKNTPVSMLTTIQLLGPLAGRPRAIFFYYLLKLVCFESLPETPAYAPFWHVGCIMWV